MPIQSADIIEHLHSLRHYASALMGSQERADHLIDLCLERLLADQARLNAKCLRLAMFAMFDLVCEQAGRGLDGVGHESLPGALHRLPPNDRKVLLLTGLARFSHREAAAILRTSAPAVTRCVLAARARLRRTLSRKVLVIEDEPIIAHVLRHMGHEVCGIAHTRRQALARAGERQRHLILADVWLGDGDDGVATVREIVCRRPVPVIFVTGHTQEMIGDRPPCPSLVIAKPFAPHTLEAAVRRILGAAAM